MKFGICTGLDKAPLAKRQGWDYLEGHVQALLQGLVADADWRQLDAIRASELPVLACNSMVPAQLPITGPNADLAALRNYMTTVLTRANRAGIKTVVFGSGGARNVPAGFARDVARKQIVDFAAMFAPIAADNGVTIVAEPLNKGECNIINGVAEAMQYVKAVNHRGFGCLVDSYHSWKENEPLDDVRAAMPWIRHVHVADLAGRVGPGLSGQSDYQPFFKVLKEGDYRGSISVECDRLDLAADGAKVLDFVKRQWDQA